MLQVETGPGPLELLAESCKRICPASVKSLTTEPNKSSTNHTATTTTTSTTSGSENVRRLEQHEAPTTVDVVKADCSSSDDGGVRMWWWPAIPNDRHSEGPLFSAISSSDNLRLGLGSVVWLWQYQELFPATTTNDGFQNGELFRMADRRNGGPEPRMSAEF